MNDVLGSPVKVGVLRTLSREGVSGLTGRDIARQSRASPSQTIWALTQLEATGLVYREVAGRSHVWRLADHALKPLITNMFTGERNAISELKTDLEVALHALPVRGAWLFGSVVRGEERPGSDVDLLVHVRTPDDKERVEAALDSLATNFVVKFGNPLAAVVVADSGARGAASPNSLRHLLAGAIPLVDPE